MVPPAEFHCGIDVINPPLIEKGIVTLNQRCGTVKQIGKYWRWEEDDEIMGCLTPR